MSNDPNMEEEKYHDKYKCIECGGDNDVTNESYDQSYISECSTKCKKCGYKTSWGYGFFDQSP